MFKNILLLMGNILQVGIFKHEFYHKFLMLMEKYFHTLVSKPYFPFSKDKVKMICYLKVKEFNLKNVGISKLGTDINHLFLSA